MRLSLLCILLVLILLATSCAAGPNVLKNTPDDNSNVAGFWLGLWQGFICLFTFVVSLFSDNVTIYEVHNNGGWYNFGFLIGIMMFFGGGGATGHAGKQRKS
jgi:hypothetical protein